MVGSGDPFPVSWPTDARRGYVLARGNPCWSSPSGDRSFEVPWTKPTN